MSNYRGTADRPDQAKAVAAVVAVHILLAVAILALVAVDDTVAVGVTCLGEQPLEDASRVRLVMYAGRRRLNSSIIKGSGA